MGMLDPELVDWPELDLGGIDVRGCRLLVAPTILPRPAPRAPRPDERVAFTAACTMEAFDAVEAAESAVAAVLWLANIA